MNKQVFMVAGLNYGDEGKGTTVDFLTRQFNAHTVVRYNGGSQAAHHVVTKDGAVHCFAQFGSGSLVPGVRTYLSRFMLLNPVNLDLEHKGLLSHGVTDAYQRLYVDEQSLIITPFHTYVNKAREILRGGNRHGSCGQGIWETQKYFLDFPDLAIVARDLLNTETFAAKLRSLRDYKREEIKRLINNQTNNRILKEFLLDMSSDQLMTEIVDRYQSVARKLQIVNQTRLKGLLDKPGTVIFEGAQGVLLDAYRGFFPYVSGTDTTFANAQLLLEETGYTGLVTRLGIVRAYMTRHGAGPFVTEDESLGKLIPDLHNGTGEWQGNFRIGWFDLVATKFALKQIGGVDGLVVTGLDRVQDFDDIKVCIAYNGLSQIDDFTQKGREAQAEQTEWFNTIKPEFIHHNLQVNGGPAYARWLAEQLDTTLSISSYGPTAEDKIVHTRAMAAGFFI